MNWNPVAENVLLASPTCGSRPACGLYFYGYRYYNGTTSRWVLRDPIGERAEPNAYGLVGNMPTNLFDYLGLAEYKIHVNCVCELHVNSFVRYAYRVLCPAKKSRLRPRLVDKDSSGTSFNIFEFISSCEEEEGGFIMEARGYLRLNKNIVASFHYLHKASWDNPTGEYDYNIILDHKTHLLGERPRLAERRFEEFLGKQILKERPIAKSYPGCEVYDEIMSEYREGAKGSLCVFSLKQGKTEDIIGSVFRPHRPQLYRKHDHINLYP